MRLITGLRFDFLTLPTPTPYSFFFGANNDREDRDN